MLTALLVSGWFACHTVEELHARASIIEALLPRFYKGRRGLSKYR